LAVVCGIVDPTVDKFTDDRVTISSVYTIHANQSISIAKPRSKEMNQAVLEMVANAGPIGTSVSVSTWYEAVLVPKDIDMSAIHRLADIPKYGGKILEDGYYE
jgi:hypothetical protein